MVARLRVLLAVMMTVFALFAVRLMYLQVVLAEELTAQSEQNALHSARISPLRGRILARDGTVLADNRVAFDLFYKGGEVANWARIRHLLGLEADPVPPDPRDPVQAALGRVVAHNIPDHLVAAIHELVAGQEGLYLRQRVERTYPTNLAAQTVGYTAEARGRFEGYALDEQVGIMGIEASLQEELFGVPGQMVQQVDHRGVVLHTQVVTPAQAGKDVMLTLDPTVQRMAEDALSGALTYINGERQLRGLPPEATVRGAFIALDPRTGEILALASAPSFDQNVFTKRPSDPQAVERILSDTVNLPMSNRAVEAFPPASTFKMVSSSALLEYDFVAPGTRFACSASLSFGGIRWDNWSYPNARGTYDVTDAIADSCNTYYWRAALETPGARRGWGPYMDALVAQARAFGFGQPVGIGLREEKAGRVPDDDWARAVYGHGWVPGFTLNTAIGQGDVLATPLQIAQMTALIAMNGEAVKPRLVKAVGAQATPQRPHVVDGRFWSALRTGMRKMITDYGTNRVLGPASRFPVVVAGKTGTAQNARGTGYDHVWFTGFAPFDAPELVWVAFVETGDRSTQTAVPLVRDFLAQYYEVGAQQADATR
jgi:penicillin-binding protein 2